MSDSARNLPENAPFGHQQQVALNALIPTLNPQQAAWLSGYFAALGGVAGKGTAVAPAAKPVQAAKAVPLTILYGSESGNAEGCAAEAGEAAKAAGFQPTVVDMADYSAEKLAKDSNLLVIVSTWGEGDPPESAVPFHELVMSDKAPKLDKTRFAVFALGDTSYADFCECGKQFDKRLADLGGTRILDRVDSDVDYEEPFKKWLEVVVPRMAEAAGVNESDASPDVAVVEEPLPATGSPEPAVEPYGKKNPFPAPVKSIVNLNGRGSAKLTCHVEFSLEGSGLSYEPGDVVGVIPRNCPEVVDDMLRMAGFRGDELIEDEEGTHSIAEVLETRFDVTSVNLPFIKKYAEIAKNPELDKFLEPDNKEALKEWLWGREIRDLLHDFPSAETLSTDQFLGILRKMPPRLYSIASSLRAHPDEVHLTVGAVTYDSFGRTRKGVCSTYLCDRITEGDTVNLYTHHNKNFFLPENGDTPIIMIGPGTGIAPFRAFVEEREVLGQKGKNWLFFGDQHFNTDFLYQLEWQNYLKKGVLTRMDVAFSRDTDHKIYVQHRMKEQARDIYAWMKEGAFFYVCGDASRMAKDVHQALIDIYTEQGAMTPEAAETAVKELQKSKRYQRDVY
jgi:sulfite reductase (NADPH) flavoprotein alpha-component